MEEDLKKIENCNKKNDLQITKFVSILIIVIISWILIELWLKVLENFAYNTLGMNSSSTWHSLIIAVTITLIFILILEFMEEDGTNIKNNVSCVNTAHNVNPVKIL